MKSILQLNLKRRMAFMPLQSLSLQMHVFKQFQMKISSLGGKILLDKISCSAYMRVDVNGKIL